MSEKDIYKCEACGVEGELNDLYTEMIDGILTCGECNGSGEVSLLADIEAHDEMVHSSKPNFNFDDLDLSDL